MSAELLFQYYSTTANTDVATGDLVFTAPGGGTSMVTGFWLCSSEQGNANELRLNHCKALETPGYSNMLIRHQASYRQKLNELYRDVKIVMQPGDKLYCALHAGDAITVTAYGIIPTESSL